MVQKGVWWGEGSSQRNCISDSVSLCPALVSRPFLPLIMHLPSQVRGSTSGEIRQPHDSRCKKRVWVASVEKEWSSGKGMICAGSRPPSPSPFSASLPCFKRQRFAPDFGAVCLRFVYTCTVHVRPSRACSSSVPAKPKCVWQKSSGASFSIGDHVCFRLLTRNSTPAFRPILKFPVFLPVYWIYSDLDLVFVMWMTCFKDDTLPMMTGFIVLGSSQVWTWLKLSVKQRGYGSKASLTKCPKVEQRLINML